MGRLVWVACTSTYYLAYQAVCMDDEIDTIEFTSFANTGTAMVRLARGNQCSAWLRVSIIVTHVTSTAQHHSAMTCPPFLALFRLQASSEDNLAENFLYPRVFLF